MSRYQVIASVMVTALLAGRPAFTQSRTASSYQPSVTVSADRVMNIQLPNGYLVTGRVTDGSGAPVTGALLVAKSDPRFGEVAVLCDSSGTFSLPLRAGTYTIIASPASSATPSEVPRLVGSSRQGVVVNTDQSLADLVLGTGFLVTGNVSGPSGAASFLRLSLLAVSADSNGQPASGITDDAMSKAVSYAVAVSPGKYVLAATSAYGYTSGWQPTAVSAFATTKITVSRDMTKNIKLPKGYRLSGTVSDSSGTPLTGSLYVQASGSNPQKDGKATALSVMAGKYIAYLPAGAYTAVFIPVMDPAAYSGRATWTSLDVTMGSSGRTLDLVAQDGVLLSGKITDSSNRPVPDAWVDIRKALTAESFGPADIPVVAKSDAKGRYRVAVPPDTFDIHVTPPVKQTSGTP